MIQLSEAEVAGNFDITPTSIHVQRCIAKYLTHAVPTCKRVKLMRKVWFSVLIYQTFKTFK